MSTKPSEEMQAVFIEVPKGDSAHAAIMSLPLPQGVLEVSRMLSGGVRMKCVDKKEWNGGEGRGGSGLERVWLKISFHAGLGCVEIIQAPLVHHIKTTFPLFYFFLLLTFPMSRSIMVKL